MTDGILYVATGEEYINEAIQSARQTRAIMDFPIALVSHRDVDADVFDEVIIDSTPQYSYVDKPRNLPRTPFDRTLFLDTDVFLVDDVSELFDVLDHFDLAAAVDPNEAALRLKEFEYFDSLPAGIPEYNTGVILYDKSLVENNFFETWVSYHSDCHIHDQPSFRKTLSVIPVRFTAISTVYNCLINWPMQVTGEVKILHDIYGTVTQDNISDIEGRINRSKDPRILHTGRDDVSFPLSKWGDVATRFVWYIHPVRLKRYLRRKHNLVLAFVASLKTNGVGTTFKKTWRYLRTISD
ncbi:hypothetical protein [Salinibaculum salinum]|uniref:hypothetical protein n=1 Tax=Salinibaculum salinum TaxID=3131996 RepID=UPI0030EEC9D1